MHVQPILKLCENFKSIPIAKGDMLTLRNLQLDLVFVYEILHHKDFLLPNADVSLSFSYELQFFTTSWYI